MQLYVGNISYATSETSLANFFESMGEVLSAHIITNKETGQSRGFGFVEMARQSEGLEALEKLNGAELDGRQIVINKANPK